MCFRVMCMFAFLFLQFVLYIQKFVCLYWCLARVLIAVGIAWPNQLAVFAMRISVSQCVTRARLCEASARTLVVVNVDRWKYQCNAHAHHTSTLCLYACHVSYTSVLLCLYIITLWLVL